MVIALIDPYVERGGGQVVLENLLEELVRSDEAVVLAMPSLGRAKLRVPSGVEEVEIADLVQTLRSRYAGEHVVLVSNANRSHPQTYAMGGTLRRRVATTTVAILHNYPKSPAHTFAIRRVVARFSHAIVVEPGLAAIRPDAFIPSWLSTFHAVSKVDKAQVQRRRLISYARPDPSKGMHLLPPLFRFAEELGLSCEVALGTSLESNKRYELALRSQLAPWLVQGRRGPDWIKPGDIFVVPSVYGEAACLSAQEAMSRGAYVLASRVGLMSYLSPTATGIRTFAPADLDSAAKGLTDIMGLETDVFSEECVRGVSEIEERRGRWYSEVSSFLLQASKAAS
ncbi:hypothetical protein ACQ3HE_17370 [Plantibacter auratus]|uniref:hypothetical protein n=1 Tax=Plantibacter auratus TaxID=272914 RepID=UPI003D3479A5